MRVKNRESRARKAAARDAGEILATKAGIRDVLADAALMILEANGQGAAEVRRVLAAAFGTRIGISLRVERDIRHGTIKPKLTDATRVVEASGRLAEQARHMSPLKPAVPPTVHGPENSSIPFGDDNEFVVPAFLRRDA